MKIVAVIQARMGSSRLPGKMLADLAGVPIIARVVGAARDLAEIDAIVVATSDAAGDQPLADWCAQTDVACFRGDEADVLARVAGAADAHHADVVVRLTGDCPLLDPQVISETLALFRQARADYACNVAPPSWPDGLDCEVISRAALDVAAQEAVRASDREHVTPYIRANRQRFTVLNLSCPVPGMSRHRWTIDTQQDLEHAARLIDWLAGSEPKKAIGPFRWTDVLRAEEALAEEKSVSAASREPRNAGYLKSLVDERLAGAGNAPPRSYAASTALLQRAERTIPLGAQTFSKSRVQFPVGAAPLFLTAGRGSRVWDVDGNEYVDLVNGLLCVSLGYCDTDVDAAVRRQLDRGVSFSLATDLEAELAERLVRLIPAAEKVRFGKNGSDATSAAVRIARAATGRPRIIACGYHGWHDWYIGSTTRSKGVPEAVRGLTHSAPYNDLAAVEAHLATHPGEIAALIMEAANVEAPNPGYLAELKALLHRHGSLLIFDEVITGFRFHLGGAQALFGVTPDLACFGKGMANGLPISAIVGRADLMAEFEAIFVSGTFGGEALSLAASIATLDKMEREPVIQTLHSRGRVLAEAVSAEIAEAGLGEVLELKGFDPWRILAVKEQPGASAMAIKTLYITEMARRGVLALGSHNISYAHTESDLAEVVAAYRETLAIIADKLQRGRLVEELETPPLEPVFKVR